MISPVWTYLGKCSAMTKVCFEKYLIFLVATYVGALLFGTQMGLAHLWLSTGQN